MLEEGLPFLLSEASYVYCITIESFFVVISCKLVFIFGWFISFFFLRSDCLERFLFPGCLSEFPSLLSFEF